MDEEEPNHDSIQTVFHLCKNVIKNNDQLLSKEIQFNQLENQQSHQYCQFSSIIYQCSGCNSVNMCDQTHNSEIQYILLEESMVSSTMARTAIQKHKITSLQDIPSICKIQEVGSNSFYCTCFAIFWKCGMTIVCPNTI